MANKPTRNLFPWFAQSRRSSCAPSNLEGIAFVNYAGGEFQVATGSPTLRQSLLLQVPVQYLWGFHCPPPRSHTGITDMRAGCEPKGTVAGVQGWFSLLYRSEERRGGKE